MSNSIEIIGVDRGNGYTKTVNSCFRSGLVRYDTKPLSMENVVFYNGKYYGVGGKRSTAKTDHKQDETSLIFTLAGIGKEIQKRGGDIHDIILSEGLPIERCTNQNRELDEKYYQEGKTIQFGFEDRNYEITIRKVLVNPQGVSAILKLMLDGSLPDPVTIIDLGSGTLDVVTMEGNKAVLSSKKSFNMGVIECFNDAKSRIRAVTGNEIGEYVIEKIMLGEHGILPDQYENMVIDSIANYIKGIYNRLMEENYNVELLPCIFVGGGASVIKLNGGEKYFPRAKYVTNISANAYGYELAAQGYLRKMQG